MWIRSQDGGTLVKAIAITVVNAPSPNECKTKIVAFDKADPDGWNMAWYPDRETALRVLNIVVDEMECWQPVSRKRLYSTYFTRDEEETSSQFARIIDIQRIDRGIEAGEYGDGNA